jgi:hypothetical protein
MLCQPCLCRHQVKLMLAQTGMYVEEEGNAGKRLPSSFDTLG